MEKYYSHFNSDIPELEQELKNFIVQINDFLVYLVEDAKYHKSRTHGQSATCDIVYEKSPWFFKGRRHRDNMPYTDEAIIIFREQTAWRMVRKSKVTDIGDLFNGDTQHCLREVAKNCDPNRPWCGPSKFVDAQTGLTYEANYRGTDKKFEIKETVRDDCGVLIWQATCEGGYV